MRLLFLLLHFGMILCHTRPIAAHDNHKLTSHVVVRHATVASFTKHPQPWLRGQSTKSMTYDDSSIPYRTHIRRTDTATTKRTHPVPSPVVIPSAPTIRPTTSDNINIFEAISKGTTRNNKATNKKQKAIGKRSIPLASFTIDIQQTNNDTVDLTVLPEEELSYALTEYLMDAMNLEDGEVIQLESITNHTNNKTTRTSGTDKKSSMVQSFEFAANVLTNDTSSDTPLSIEQSLLLLRQQNALLDSPSDLQAVINSVIISSDANNTIYSNNTHNTSVTNHNHTSSSIVLVDVNISDSVIPTTDGDDETDAGNEGNNSNSTPIQNINEPNKSNSATIMFTVIGVVAGVVLALTLACCVRQYMTTKTGKQSYNKDRYSHQNVGGGGNDYDDDDDAILRVADNNKTTTKLSKEQQRQQYWATVSHMKNHHHHYHHHHRQHSMNVLNANLERNANPF